MDNKIQHNLVYLCDNLTNLDRILLYLVQNNIISLNESDDISKEDTPFNRNVMLLKVILRKDLPVNIFLEILRNTQNGHCANKIEGISSEVEKKLEKPKILKNLWWPDKKVLIKSLHQRKIGNKFLIEELHERILSDENRTLVICESADASKLTGLGGMGKTLTATWYAHNYENEYDHVIWINCGEGSILTSFKKLALDLRIEERNEIVDLEDFTRKSYEALEEFKCLWIFDNAESYRGDEGIKDILPKYKTNFYCLITSRWREWGVEGIGYGQLSRLELNIFCEAESLKFFKENLNEEIKYTEFQLKNLCHLLGNRPLALQLTVAALKNGNIDLKNYIEKSSAKDIENIVDAKFDDYEKTINASVNITLELISKKEGGTFAKEVLNVFGYIRPENVEKQFLTTIFNCDSDFTISEMTTAIELLTKYSLITQVVEKMKDGQIMIHLSIHRLLQQVIRHNGRNPEKNTLRKILRCNGFVDYKLLPFTKYADEELRKEFPKVRAELLDQQQLVRLVKEKRFEDSVQLAKFIDKELQRNTTKFNYAICLEMNGQLEDGIKILEKLYKRDITGEKDYHNSIEMGMLMLDKELTNSLIGGHLLVSLWKMGNKERIQEMLEERKYFMMIHSKEMMNTLMRILNSNLIQSNYNLAYDDDTSMFKIDFDGDAKKIELHDCFVDLSLALPNDLQKLVLGGLRFKEGNAEEVSMTNISNWLPKKLKTLEIFCYKPKQIILSLESISFIEDITLDYCSLSLDSGNRLSPTQLILKWVSFVENGQELPNVKVNEFIDFHNMNRIELNCINKNNLSINLSGESANMEYLTLFGVQVNSLKSAKGFGSVGIKKAKIGSCLLDLSILPPSLEKLSLFDTKVFVSGGIDLPNLKYLKLKDISDLSHFRSLHLSYLHLKKVEEVNVDLFPPSAKIIRIDKKFKTRLVGGVINLDKLILYGFPLKEVEEMLLHFQVKQLLLSSSCQPLELIQLLDKQIPPTIAIGKVDWEEDDFKNSIISKHVDRQAEYYLFHEGTGKGIEKKNFDEFGKLF